MTMNTLSRIHSAIAAFILLLASPPTTVQADQQFSIEFIFAEVPGTWLEQFKMDKSLQEVKPDIFKRLREAEADGVDLLSAPKVTTLENQEARIEIKQGPLAYMEKVGDAYQPRRMPEGTGPGLSISVKVADVPANPGYCQLEIEASISRVSGRAPLPFDLDVGIPIIKKRESTTTITCFNGKWYLLDLGLMEPDNGKSVVFCRVGKVSQSAKAEIPHNVVADKMTLNEETGLFSFEGNVQVQSEEMEIYAESLEFNPAQDKGKEPGIQADRFSFDAPGGRIALEGNVRFRTPQGLILAQRLNVQQVGDEKAKAEGELEKKLKAIVIPTLEFKEVGLQDAVSYLQQASKQHSKDGKGVNIIVKPNALRDQGVNMSLRNLTLYHILKYLAESTDNSLVLDEEAGLVVIGTDKSTDPFEDPFEH